MSNRLTDQIPANLRMLCVALAALVLSGCAGSTGAASSTGQPSASPTALSVTTAATVATRSPPPSHPRHRTHPAPPPRHRSGMLAYSTASSQIVHAQPAPGACHAIGSGPYARPAPACTPGALNPAVTQGTIDRTICVAGWTKTVRPPESITEREKAASMAAYGDTGSMGAYEYDHFVPLELGGATNDARNLWPEPGASPNPKDAVEDQLRQDVCDGQLSLAQAQHEIVTNWVSLARRSNQSGTTSPAPGTPAPSRAGDCTVSASYSSRYHDYDVYVRSNQPDQTVTVTDAGGHSASWHTNASGYADVYFKSGGPAPGRQITARVGAATCSTQL